MCTAHVGPSQVKGPRGRGAVHLLWVLLFAGSSLPPPNHLTRSPSLLYLLTPPRSGGENEKEGGRGWKMTGIPADTPASVRGGREGKRGDGYQQSAWGNGGRRETGVSPHTSPLLPSSLPSPLLRCVRGKQRRGSEPSRFLASAQWGQGPC